MKYIKRRRNKSINIEDLLGREPVCLDDKLIKENIKGKTVLVTGGGGSIGSQLCRQVMEFSPKRLVVLDIYENNVYNLLREFTELYPDVNIDAEIASVRDMARMDEVFAKHRPNMVFHAAAHKHVPLMEANPGEAVKNNVFGTYNTVVCADKYGAEKFVFISTDKAVKPISVLGATKRIGEMITEAIQEKSQTVFAAVRFGNVLGSAGSVVPQFIKQIESGGPVTVTHIDVTRFFMTTTEAVQLVLQATAYAQGGETFALDMGNPVRIYDLAKNMIEQYGYIPDKDIRIEFTGLRAGDKLFEELIEDGRIAEKTENRKISVMQNSGQSRLKDIDKGLEKLKEVISDNERVRQVLAEIVPEYDIKKKG